MAEHVVECYADRFGPQDERTLSAMSTLVKIATAQGDVGRAAELLTTLADGYERARDPDHADTLQARYNLGVVRVHLHDFPGAITELEAVVEARRRTLGAEDPETQRAEETLLEVRKRARRSRP